MQKYRFYNANPKGLFENDCTIRAISLATGKSWDEVYENLSDIAQFEGTMMDDRDFIIKYLSTKYKKVPYLADTVGEVADNYPNNILLITMNGHITCSKYGVIYDSFDPRERVVEEAWIVK